MSTELDSSLRTVEPSRPRSHAREAIAALFVAAAASVIFIHSVHVDTKQLYEDAYVSGDDGCLRGGVYDPAKGATLDDRGLLSPHLDVTPNGGATEAHPTITFGFEKSTNTVSIVPSEGSLAQLAIEGC